MKNIIALLHKDQYRVCGLIFILISFSSIICSHYYLLHKTSNTLYFLFSYTLSVVYSLGIFLKKYTLRYEKAWGNRLPYTIYTLILWLISAFALNGNKNLVENSIWLISYAMISCIALILYTFFRLLPIYMKHIVAFTLGSSLVLFIFYAIYLFPIYPMAILIIPIIGISLHAFVPVALSIISIVCLIRINREYPKLKFTIIHGILFPMLICSFLLFLGKLTLPELPWRELRALRSIF